MKFIFITTLFVTNRVFLYLLLQDAFIHKAVFCDVQLGKHSLKCGRLSHYPLVVGSDIADYN